VELHGSDGHGCVLNGHDDAVGTFGSDDEFLGHFGHFPMERVIPCDGELGRQPTKDIVGQATAAAAGLGVVIGALDGRRLSMHGVVQNSELAAKVFHEPLQSQANPKDGHLAGNHGINRRRELKVGRAARTWGQNCQVGLEFAAVDALGEKLLKGGATASGDHVGASLTQVVGQRVNKRILVVDQQDLWPVLDNHNVIAWFPREGAHGCNVLGRVVSTHDGVNERRGLEFSLCFLSRGIAVVYGVAVQGED